MSLKRQQEVIDLVKDRRQDSYLLWGDPETGKTHITTALYREALWAWSRKTDVSDEVRAVWRIKTSVWLDEMRAYANRNREDEGSRVPRPSLMGYEVEHARAVGSRPVVILDELDKFKYSEWNMEQLYKLVDTVYEASGQLIGTSNLDPKQLARQWAPPKGSALQWGEPMIRRFIDPSRGHSVQFKRAVEKAVRKTTT